LRLFVNDYGIFLGRKGDRVIIKRRGEKIGEVPAGNLSQVILASRGVSISSDLLRLIFKHHIDFVVLSGYGTPLGRLASRRGGAINLRKNQIAAQSNWKGSHLIKQFGKAKLLNQANLLRSMAKNRRSTKPALASVLEKCSWEILDKVKMIDSLQMSDNENIRRKVLFLEAEGSEVYWYGIARLLDGVIDFQGRKKRPDHPEDLTNMLLNYGYGILFSEVWKAVEFASLEPYAGFLHVDSPRRPALVADLMEEFRQPVVDRAVIKILFDAKNMSELVDRGCLTLEGRKRVVSEIIGRFESRVTFQERSLPIDVHILHQTRRLAEFLLERRKEYVPFITRW
jgi:CRISPR-associated protein Cas1